MSKPTFCTVSVWLYSALDFCFFHLYLHIPERTAVYHYSPGRRPCICLLLWKTSSVEMLFHPGGNLTFSGSQWVSAISLGCVCYSSAIFGNADTQLSEFIIPVDEEGRVSCQDQQLQLAFYHNGPHFYSHVIRITFFMFWWLIKTTFRVSAEFLFWNTRNTICDRSIDLLLGTMK